MPDTIKLARKTPLDAYKITGQGVSITPVSAMSKVMLQRSSRVTDTEMDKFSRVFEQKFGFCFPVAVCEKTESRDGSRTVLCIGPDTWIILSPPQESAALINWVEKAAGNKTITASDMTDQFTCVDITGEHANPLLAKGCALDVSKDVFSVNHTARTLLAQANIVLWRLEDSGFRILFDVSLCDYLWAWLEGSSREFLTLGSCENR